MTATFDKLVSVDTILARLDLPVTKQAAHNLRRLLRSHRIPDYRLGRRVFYRPDDVAAFMSAHRQPHGLRKSA